MGVRKMHPLEKRHETVTLVNHRIGVIAGHCLTNRAEEFNESGGLRCAPNDHKEVGMLVSDRKHKHFSTIARNSVAVIATVVLAVKIAAAQNLPPAVPPALPGTSAIRLPGLSGLSSFSSDVVTADRPGQVSNAIAAGFAGGRDSAERQPVRSERPRRITLEQVKQSANRMASPLAYISHLSVEVAKQHRLGVQADYFPKFGATFVNLHFTDFLGQIVEVRRPLMGGVTQVPVQIINQNQTLAALTFVQPITPLFEVRQAVRVARADERIAMAKAAASVSKNSRDTGIEETYFKLLIAQRQLTSAEWKLRNGERRPLYASAAVDLVRVNSEQETGTEASKAVDTAAGRVRELTASLNRVMGWPDDTELELSVPNPLVENISLQEVADKPTAATPALVEAEQTVVKAHAASSISKMAYFPTVAAVGGYMFQNVLPAANSNFGYGGVMASYTLFDFGKREHAVKEARAQLGMAETALQLTKAKLAADVKKSYFDLERTRQLSQVVQKMGSSTALLMKISSDSENLEVRRARADVELEMIEADFAHRQAFNRLKAVIDPGR
jgi:outer membrane protein